MNVCNGMIHFTYFIPIKLETVKAFTFFQYEESSHEYYH